MHHYDHFDNIKIDPSLMGDEIWASNKLDGQNLCARYSPKNKAFVAFGSRKRIVDETDEQFGKAVQWFKEHYADGLCKLIKLYSGKGEVFNGVEEITMFFEWYGDNSFAGFHQDGDELRLALIDVFCKKRGYMEPKEFYTIFKDIEWLEIPELVYRGKLTAEFAESIRTNDWTQQGCKYPSVKEGVVCRRSTMMKGQKLPRVKIKTQWWLDKLHANYSEDKWKEME